MTIVIGSIINYLESIPLHSKYLSNLQTARH